MSRRLAAAALIAFLPAGCHVPISTEVAWRPERPPAAAPLARARNELSLGILPPRVASLDDPGAPAPEDAGDAKAIGRALADAIEDARLFAQVRYPLRDEKVDVVLEPIVRVSLSKNRATNALKVFPGILLPWIDGFGLDYDHAIALELTVRAGPDRAACERRVARADLTAERYPSILWWLGLHAGLLILLVFESATTDHAVLERLVERDSEQAIREGVSWLVAEFQPEAKRCPDHKDVPATGKFCVYCGRNLWYPILDRRAAPGGITETAR